jgi:hypothetical protein
MHANSQNKQYRIQKTETHVHKIINVPVFYMALGFNDFDAGKSITRAHPFQWLSKWIFLHQNPYVPRHINIRYINSSLCPLTTPPPSLEGRSEFTLSRSPPPPTTQTALCTEQFRNQQRYESALDRPPLHNKLITTGMSLDSPSCLIYVLCLGRVRRTCGAGRILNR